MYVPVIAIGKTKAIRLSKTLIEKYNIQDKLELMLEMDRIILKPARSPRKGWDNAFRKMHEAGDDLQLIAYVFEDGPSLNGNETVSGGNGQSRSHPWKRDE